MDLCAITDRGRLTDPVHAGSPFPGERTSGAGQPLRQLVAGWIEGGVDYIQLREKDLDARALRRLAEDIVSGIDKRTTRLLINFSLPWGLEASAGLAMLAPVADGIHLPGRPVAGAVERVRRVFRSCGRVATVSVACHELDEVRIAEAERPDFILFAPVFEKGGKRKEEGLEMLRLACRAAGSVPVLALGGVTVARAARCVAAGARGVAGIRLFLTESGREGWRQLLPPRAPGRPGDGAAGGLTGGEAGIPADRADDDPTDI